MVKPHFADVDMDCGRHPGKLGIAEPSVYVCVTDPEAIDILSQAISELMADGSPSKRTLTFRASENPKRQKLLRLRLLPGGDELRVMHIGCSGDSVEIDLTLIGLELLRGAIASWRNGNEDFGIAPRHSRLRKAELGVRDLASGEHWFWGPTYAGP